jgi:hypothetical protein
MKLNNPPFAYAIFAVALSLGCIATGRSLPQHSSSAERFARMGVELALPDTTNRADQPAENIFKNIQVLKGIPARQVLPTMRFFEMSLGVGCDFCHVRGNFASDEKPEKKTARSMILMMNDINAKNFSAQEVTCFTCHGGRSHPLVTPMLSQDAWQMFDRRGRASIPADSGMTARQVLDRYVQALGGAKALAKIMTRVMMASEVQSDSATATVEMYQKSPDLLRSTTTPNDPKYPQHIEAYNGATGWRLMNPRPANDLGGEELAQLTRAAELFPAADLSSFTDVKLLGKEKVGDREVNVITAASRDGSRDKLYFDTKSGLLVRRYVEYRTPLGPLPFAINYDEYREIDGVKVPYTQKWSLPGEEWTDTITQLRNNVPIADSMFVKPAGGVQPERR